MKKKVLALTLAAVLAFSSTSAFAAETTNCTKVTTKYDFSKLLKNYSGKINNANVTYKVTVNGKAVDLNSVDWNALLNKNTTNTTETVVKTPAATTPKTAEPVVKAPVATVPVETKTVEKPAVPAPAPARAPVPAPTTTPVVSTNTAVSSYEQKVVELVNVERQKAGLPALKLDTAMSNVARMKSKDMADNNYFAHQSPTYGSAGDMLTKFGIRWSAWGENIASGQRTPEAVVTAWMNSSGHRANIMSTNFSRIGVGYVTNANGTPYWTQMFAN